MLDCICFQYYNVHFAHFFRLLLAEAALKNFESENALETAEAAFVRRNDYAGIRFVSRLNALHSNALKKAEILAYFKDFDAAEKIYHNEDRRLVQCLFRIPFHRSRVRS